MNGNDLNYNSNYDNNNNNSSNNNSSSATTQDIPMEINSNSNVDNKPNTNTSSSNSIEQRPVFIGNLSTMCNIKDIEDIFERPILNGVHGPIEIERIDLKRGFGFVFLKNARSLDERDAVEKYVGDLNGMEVPNVSKQLRAELARGDGRIKRKEDVRRQNIIPNETLFVVNFHEETTRKEDLEMLFSPYGELVRIDMKKNYAFVQFANVDQSKRAKDATNGGKLDQSVITVEYVARRDREDGANTRRDHRSRNNGSPDRHERRNRSPNRFRDDRSPPRRGRSPDRFRDRDRYERRSRYGSPDNNRSSRYHRHSPSRRDTRSSPDRDSYHRRRNSSRSRSRSPFNHRRGGSKFRSSPPRGRDSYKNSRRDDRGDGDDRKDRNTGFRSDDRGYAGRDNDNNL